MPYFVLNCIDRPDGLEARLGAREAHLAYVRESGKLRLGGPFLNDKGEMAGSLMIIEVADLAAAQAFSANDPYVKAGVFENVDIREFRTTFGSL